MAINGDPFKESDAKFSYLVNKAKSDKLFRAAYLLEASNLKSTITDVSLELQKDYKQLVDSEVYSHVTRRLSEIVEQIRHHIHRNEFDKAAAYVSDMRILGDFIKRKGLQFDFEFYDKIEEFFHTKKEKDAKIAPRF